MLREIVQDKLDILLISETKVDPSFPSSQFAIDGFSSPFRLDRNSSGGDIMLFVREEIPSKNLSEYKPNSSVENIFIEINLRSKKWLLSRSYNPNLTLSASILQNGQTHANNSSAICRRIVWVCLTILSDCRLKC